MATQSMKKFVEIKEIAKCVAKIDNYVKNLSKNFDVDGINWFSASFVSVGKEDIEHFKETNGATEEYYVDQWTGYAEDDYHGELYFKTNVPGQYVRVHFDM